ncbi:hypothetical protein BS78_02G102600 [Paspalum vaginatum]|nr:hypothetical protein BS78_02G102600 [Paspalum vaginatum]
MATTCHLLSLSAAAAVLLSVLAACAATVDPSACAPGMAIPAPPVPSCRIYAVSLACGLGGPYGVALDPSPVLRDRCCRELAAVPPRCRYAQRELACRLTRPEECDLATVDGGMCYALATQGDVAVSAIA